MHLKIFVHFSKPTSQTGSKISWSGSVSLYLDYHALGMNLRCFETCFNKQKLLKNKEQEQEKESKKGKKEQTEQKKIENLVSEER